jgi:hypothetical protein
VNSSSKFTQLGFDSNIPIGIILEDQGCRIRVFDDPIFSKIAFELDHAQVLNDESTLPV